MYIPKLHPTTIRNRNHPKSMNGGINISVKKVKATRYEPQSTIISVCRNKRIRKSFMLIYEVLSKGSTLMPRGSEPKPNIVA